MSLANYIITTFYKFVPLDNLPEIKLQLTKMLKADGIKGTVLIAEEGINSTICGSRLAINNFYNSIKQIPEFQSMEYKESEAAIPPFKKLKVKIKPETITFKVSNLDLNQKGEYLSSKEWEELLENPDSLIIDTRNDCEIQYGTFQNAVNPKTDKFTEFPKWAQDQLADVPKDKKIGMFCTGGVRCEKSTALLKSMGFKNVYHLHGGILQYLIDTKNNKNFWKGKCFVFDDRITVDDELRPNNE